MTSTADTGRDAQGDDPGPPAADLGPPPRLLDDLAVAFVGTGGDGVITLGEVLLATAAAAGWHGALTKHYGPQIRGGESLSRVRLGRRPVAAHRDALDWVVVLSWGNAARFAEELRLAPGGLVLSDDADPAPQTARRLGPHPVPPARELRLPLSRLATEQLRDPLSRNVIALGALAELADLPRPPLLEALEKRLAGRPPLPGAPPPDRPLAMRLGAEAARAALAAAAAPASTQAPADAETPERAVSPAAGPPETGRVLATGNEALARGLLDEGLGFFAGYPITPASDLLELFARELPGRGGQVVQAEDEIAACAMALGASYGGVPAATATSGPGLSLMQELLGLATMAELPLVVVDVQRCGPATGIPTKTEQADLLAAIFGAHGDAPRLVLAPRDVADAYRAGVAAVSLAEAYQLPVVVLSDQLLGQRKETLPADELRPGDALGAMLGPRRRRLLAAAPLQNAAGPYVRFADDPAGVSPMALPGLAGGMHYLAGIEHDEQGHPSASPEVHQAMSERRARKLRAAAREVPLLADVRRLGRAAEAGEADLVVLTWGSAAQVLEEALAHVAVRRPDARVRGLAPLALYPLPVDVLERALAGARRTLVVELSAGAQFRRHLQAELGRRFPDVHARAGGRPLGVEEVVQVIERALAGEVVG